jgi:hypothetical protein
MREFLKELLGLILEGRIIWVILYMEHCGIRHLKTVEQCLCQGLGEAFIQVPQGIFKALEPLLVVDTESIFPGKGRHRFVVLLFADHTLSP